jgi:hypothetical protein
MADTRQALAQLAGKPCVEHPAVAFGFEPFASSPAPAPGSKSGMN